MFVPEPEDIHQFDQAASFVADNLPPMLFRFYKNLLEAGFNDMQAMHLVEEYMCISLTR